jgi:hypothetical protein
MVSHLKWVRVLYTRQDIESLIRCMPGGLLSKDSLMSIGKFNIQSLQVNNVITFLVCARNLRYHFIKTMTLKFQKLKKSDRLLFQETPLFLSFK